MRRLVYLTAAIVMAAALFSVCPALGQAQPFGGPPRPPASAPYVAPGSTPILPSYRAPVSSFSGYRAPVYGAPTYRAPMSSSLGYRPPFYSPSGFSPFVSCIVGPFALALGIYSIVLQVLAIDAVENIGTWKSVATFFIPAVILVVLTICCSLTILVPLFSSYLPNLQ